MSSRRRATIAALIAAAFLPPSALAATAALSDLPRGGDVYATVHASCAAKGRTLAANRHVRVFNPTADHGRSILACRRRSHRAYVIGNPGECQNSAEIDTAVVAGTYAAINVLTCSLTHTDAGLGLVDLRNGHIVFSSGALSTPSQESEGDGIRGMLVTPRGRVAWLAVRRSGLTVIGVEVRRRAHGPDRHSVLLDSSPSIDPRSLRRRGDRVYWTKAGVLRSASM